MSNSKFLPFLFSYCIISIIQLSSQQCIEQHKNALLKIKDSLGYSSSLSTWNNHTDCCDFWEGVYCQIFTGNVYILYISNSNFSGPIPSAFAELPDKIPDLMRLNIDNHPKMTGPIPESFQKFQSLERLAITRTSISGNIPSFLCGLHKLYSLDLSDNRFNGSIPGCFSNHVYIINLNDNQLTGHIPGSLFQGYIGNDTALNLRNNRLTGKIPSSFSELNFDNLDLSENNLTGDASFLFDRSKFTYQIKLSHNKFKFDMSNLTYPLYMGWLDLSHNKIRGSINQQITELQGLGILDVSYNRLCGPIPSGLWMRPYDPSTFEHNKCLCATPLPPCA